MAGGVPAAGFKTIDLEKNTVVGGGGNLMQGAFAVACRMQEVNNIGVEAVRPRSFTVLTVFNEVSDLER